MQKKTYHFSCTFHHAASTYIILTIYFEKFYEGNINIHFSVKISSLLSHRSRQNPLSVLVLYNFNPQLHTWVCQNSSTNMLTAPLSEWTIPHMLIGLPYKHHDKNFHQRFSLLRKEDLEGDLAMIP